MKKTVLFLMIISVVQLSLPAFCGASNDLIIPSIGVRGRVGESPEIKIGVPESEMPQTNSVYGNSPFQSQLDDVSDRLYVEPKQKTKSVKEWMNSKPEGVNIKLQQPSIKVGG